VLNCYSQLIFKANQVPREKHDNYSLIALIEPQKMNMSLQQTVAEAHKRGRQVHGKGATYWKTFKEGFSLLFQR
jgi:hypothetical protein